MPQLEGEEAAEAGRKGGAHFRADEKAGAFARGGGRVHHERGAGGRKDAGGDGSALATDVGRRVGKGAPGLVRESLGGASGGTVSVTRATFWREREFRLRMRVSAVTRKQKELRKTPRLPKS